MLKGGNEDFLQSGKKENGMGEVKNYPPYLDYPKPYKAKTNADRIRAMSDEELRNWLFQRDCKNIAAFLQYGGANIMDAAQLLDWLRQPAEEDDHAE